MIEIIEKDYEMVNIAELMMNAEIVELTMNEEIAKLTMNEETAMMNEEIEIVELEVSGLIAATMDDEIIEQAMNEMMMMNVELLMKIVEFGMIENCELTTNEEIFEKASYEEIAATMNEGIVEKMTSE